MAYELELPIRSKIHNVFHVSCLNKFIGQHISVSNTLPPLDDEGKLVLIPEKNIDNKGEKVKKLNNKRILGTMEGFS